MDQEDDEQDDDRSVKAAKKSSRRDKVGSTSRDRKAVTILDPTSGVSSRVTVSPKKSLLNSPEGLKKQKTVKKDIDLADFSKKFEVQLFDKINPMLQTYLKRSEFDKVIDKVDEQS